MLGVIGLAGIPDDLQTWGKWASAVPVELALRWVFVLAGLAIIVMANKDALGLVDTPQILRGRLGRLRIRIGGWSCTGYDVLARHGLGFTTAKQADEWAYEALLDCSVASRIAWGDRDDWSRSRTAQEVARGAILQVVNHMRYKGWLEESEHSPKTLPEFRKYVLTTKGEERVRAAKAKAKKRLARLFPD